MYLLDTNIISETSKSKPSMAVMTWLRQHKGFFISVISTQEIIYGIDSSVPCLPQNKIFLHLRIPARILLI